jgi:hypothetical protein
MKISNLYSSRAQPQRTTIAGNCTSHFPPCSRFTTPARPASVGTWVDATLYLQIRDSGPRRRQDSKYHIGFGTYDLASATRRAALSSTYPAAAPRRDGSTAYLHVLPLPPATTPPLLHFRLLSRPASRLRSGTPVNLSLDGDKAIYDHTRKP